MSFLAVLRSPGKVFQRLYWEIASAGSALSGCMRLIDLMNREIKVS
jgi:hypothetical protein